MFTQNKITIGARCSHCCEEIKAELSIFSLSGGKIVKRCKNCGESTLEITLSEDGKVRLSIPCVACPHPHPFTLSPETVFKKELFILQCSFTRLDICFMGDENKVNEALVENGKELREMMQEDEAHGEGSEEKIRVLLSFINECAEKGKILCRCKNMKNAIGAELQIYEDKVVLRCRDCGRELAFPIDDEDLLDKCIDLGAIVLDDEK